MAETEITRPNTFYVRHGKRLLDLILAALGLLAVAPVMLVIASFSLLLIGRPILFFQERAGFRGKPFRLIKFRSMLNTCDAAGHLLPDKGRLTALGKFLRSTSLDELPGLWNVLKGEMTLIGPRALPIEYCKYYTERQSARLAAVPGMAGYAALFGRNAQDWESIFERDIWYVQRISLLLDLKIIFRIFFVVLSRKGIDRGDYDRGSAFAEAIGKGKPIKSRDSEPCRK